VLKKIPVVISKVKNKAQRTPQDREDYFKQYSIIENKQKRLFTYMKG